MKWIIFVAAFSWIGLWLTPDQQGQRQLRRGEFIQAARSFQDPMRQGEAWYRAGEFEKAAQAFARVRGSEADYNQGNAWLMRGSYSAAIASYDAALMKREDWQEALENRQLAVARAASLEQEGGDMGDQKIGADKIVFDKSKKAGDEGQDTQVGGDKAVTDASVQALWLRRVQTKPADFLKAKFSYQNADSQNIEK